MESGDLGKFFLPIRIGQGRRSRIHHLDLEGPSRLFPPMIRFALHLLTILNLLALHQSALVPLLRLRASDLTQGIFDRGLDQAPFVIEDGAREWPASSKWNWEHIRRVCGSMSLAPSCMGDTPLIKARTSQTCELHVLLSSVSNCHS